MPNTTRTRCEWLVKLQIYGSIGEVICLAIQGKSVYRLALSRPVFTQNNFLSDGE